MTPLAGEHIHITVDAAPFTTATQKVRAALAGAHNEASHDPVLAAAAEVLHHQYGAPDDNCDWTEDAAPIVAAVRPLIAAETLDRVASFHTSVDCPWAWNEPVETCPCDFARTIRTLRGTPA